MRSTPAPASASPDCTTCRTSVQCALEPDRQAPAARPTGAGGFVLFLALLVALAGLSGCSKDVEITPPHASSDSTGKRADEAQLQLDHLVRAVRDGSRSDAVA